MATIENKRFTKFRLQLELLASHTSYNSEDFVFKYSYNGVVLPTTNYGDIILHEVRYKIGSYFSIEYYVGNVRLLDTYNLTDDCELVCNAIIGEVVNHISGCIDCITVAFKDKESANDFMNSYLASTDNFITEEFSSKDTIVYHYSGSDFVVIYTTDFVNKGAYRINKFFVENLVDYKYLKSDTIKNFKLIKHYTDIVYSAKDTEIAYY